MDALDTRLSVAEESALAQHEATIERGLRTFTEVGNALLAIRDERLYRREFGTFEEYIEMRWPEIGGRRRAYQLMEAARVVSNVQFFAHPDAPVHLPANDAQARPLATLPPDQQAAAWGEAIETAPNGKVTAAHVQAIVDRYKAPAFDPEVDPEPADDWADDGPEANDEWLADPDDSDDEPALISAAPQPNRLAPLMSSESPDWYTPAHIIDAVVDVLGAIDLDPCSNSHESPNVPATLRYTAEDDGLAHDWTGRVFMNPPWSKDQPIEDWIRKLRESYRAGSVSEAIALVPNNTDTRWWELIADYPVCFIRRRLRFLSPDDKPTSSATFASAVVYLGPDVERFADVFDELGATYQRV